MIFLLSRKAEEDAVSGLWDLAGGTLLSTRCVA